MAYETPRGVALRIALIGASAATALILTYELISGGALHLPLIGGVLAATFVATYLISAWAIEKFIYQKVKIIYKTIHRFKGSTGKAREVRMDEDVISKVNAEVMHWAEDKIKEISTLKEQDNFRRDFIGNLAHELKTPIFNIQGYVLTLLEGALEDPENNRKFLIKAAKNVDRITALLEDLDTISRIEGGIYQLKESKFDLVELTNDVIESLDNRARRGNITLRLKNPKEKALFVWGDRPKIEQVLFNLLANSINYGNDGGETRVRFYDMEDTILIEVADNGIGIAEEHLPRIFERFYRVDKSRSRHVGGSGLGLAIVKHIIDAHDQTINVRSSTGVGTTFSFTLRKA